MALARFVVALSATVCLLAAIAGVSGPARADSIVFDNGDRYEGDVSYGQPHGSGIFKWSGGAMYFGDFRQGKRHGKGRHQMADGWEFKGQWHDGRFVHGSITDADGFLLYEGDVRAGKPHGRGVRWWPGGDRFEGEFADGEPRGQGVLIKTDGRRYEGEYRGGKFDGREIVSSTSTGRTALQPQDRSAIDKAQGPASTAGASGAGGHGLQLAELKLDAGKLGDAASKAVSRWPAAQQADPAWEWVRVLVFLVQSALVAQGYDPGKPDGLMGPQTMLALIAWSAVSGPLWNGGNAMSYLWGIDDNVAHLLHGTLEAMGLSPGPKDRLFGPRSVTALEHWDSVFRLGAMSMDINEEFGMQIVMNHFGADRPDDTQEARSPPAERATGGTPAGSPKCLKLYKDDYDNVYFRNSCQQTASVLFRTDRGPCASQPDGAKYPCWAGPLDHDQMSYVSMPLKPYSNLGNAKAPDYGSFYVRECIEPMAITEVRRGVVICVDPRRGGVVLLHPFLMLRDPSYGDPYTHPDLAPYRPKEWE